MRTACLSVFIVALYLYISTNAFATARVNIHLNKTSDEWLIAYSASTPTQKIAFLSTPSEARTTRWRPVNTAFEVVFEDHQELIRRKDGLVFDYVQLSLTPTYTHLPKAYAPFAPFSDGGALIHTGRLFACLDFCSDDANGWKITVEVEENSHFIANGKINYQSASWLGYNDGQYVYIGEQMPIDEPTFMALIDTELPHDIKVEINHTLPKLMAFFESKLGQHNNDVKPMLFASYSNTPGTDTQGGVLPNQVFIHWDMDNLDERLQNKNFIPTTLWMFAHEAAHFFQDSKSLVNNKSASWIHEGNAEWLAALALREFSPETIEPFIENKMNEAKKGCAKALVNYPLIDAAKHGQYRAYYQCGMLIHSLIDLKARELSQGKYSIFDIWNNFKQQSLRTGTNGAKGFWLAAEPYIPSDMLKKLKRLTTDKITSPAIYIEQLESL